MRSVTATTAAIVLTLSGSAPLLAQDRLANDSSLSAMVAAERAFAQHSVRLGTQSAFMTFMAENGVLFRPRAVRAVMYLRARPMPADLALIWEPVFADMSAAGDFGYTTGPWIGSSRTRTDVEPTFGEYVTIWRRQPDGSWKAEVDAGIPHSPDPVGPTAVRAAPAAAWRRPAAQAKTALSSLLAADSALAAVASKDGAAAAFGARSEPHLRLLRTGRFPLMADSATAFLRAASGYTWKAGSGAVSDSGDLGYTTGVYVILTDRTTNQASERGEYLRIWRRTSAGVWRVALDLTSPM